MPKKEFDLNYKVVSISNRMESYLSNHMISSKEGAKLMGVSESTFKKMNIPHNLTQGGHRKYNLMELIRVITAITNQN